MLRLSPVATALAHEPWLAAANALNLAWRILKWGIQDSATDDAHLARDTTRSQFHVLATATSLLGICALIILVLKLTNENSKTYADEVAWIAAVCMIARIALFRHGVAQAAWRTTLADWSFLGGVAALMLSLLIAIWQL